MAWSKDELRKIAEAEQTELSLVSGRVAAKGRPYHRCGYDKGSGFRACRRFHQ